MQQKHLAAQSAGSWAGRLGGWEQGGPEQITVLTGWLGREQDIFERIATAA